MDTLNCRFRTWAQTARRLIALSCAAILFLGDVSLFSQSQESPPGQKQPQEQKNGQAGEEKAAKLTPDQLDSLVAPIALYPDELLAQTLAASTYPLEIRSEE